MNQTPRDDEAIDTTVGSNQLPLTLPQNQEEMQEVQSQANENTQTDSGIENDKKKEKESPNKKGLKSVAWTHFHRNKIDGKFKEICKYCAKKLDGETRNGTKHLHDHIKSCKRYTKKGPSQSIIKTLAQSSCIGDKDDTFVVGNYSFNQDIARTELANAIVLHEYPLSIVDHYGFKRFCGAMQPLFKLVSRNTIKSDIMKLYESEKSKVLKVLNKNSSRVAITTDMWTSNNQNKGYMTLTTHFIDDNWSLQHRLLRFIYVPAPHTAEVLSHVLVDCLFDWKLDRKLSTLIADNCSTNDAMIECIREKISSSNFILHGTLFHMRCCAHILNLIVKDGLLTIKDAIRNIRDSVAYWVATPKREEKFGHTCVQLDIAYSRKLIQDCKTRWNSTYLMIASALPYKDVFYRLTQREPDFKTCPTLEDWKIASEIYEKLEVFYAVTQLFSGSNYPTLNVYFPKVCEIRLCIKSWLCSSSKVIENMAISMAQKFDKYWSKISGMMAIGAVLDPRYKMKLLNYFFPLIYGEECTNELRKVKKLCEDLVAEYQAKDKRIIHNRSETSSQSLTEVNPQKKLDAWECGYFQFVQETLSENNSKSELETYLEEPVLLSKPNEAFDILGYWKQIGVKYPTLQRIARDFFAIPISTVASESAFSTGGRVLSPHRSSLNEKTVEALMCCQDWLLNTIRGSSKRKAESQTIIDDEDVE